MSAMFLNLDLETHPMPAPGAVLDAITKAFLSLAANDSDQPLQTAVVLPDGAGDCIFYPAYVRSASVFGVKVSPYLRSRSKLGLPPVTAYTLIVSAETGLPTMLVDARRLTTERTAATTVIAVRLLSSSAPPRSIGIVGTGPIGRSHARYARAVFPNCDILMFSPFAAGRGSDGELRREAVRTECESAECVDSLSEVVGCDVVMLCTSSGRPVIDVNETSSYAIITSVGTNLPDTHEIDWRHLPEIDVYCDYRKTCPTTAGDMRLAIRAGIWDPSDVLADLPELLRGSFLAVSQRRRYFRATGLALEDIAIAMLLAPSTAAERREVR